MIHMTRTFLLPLAVLLALAGSAAAQDDTDPFADDSDPFAEVDALLDEHEQSAAQALDETASTAAQAAAQEPAPTPEEPAAAPPAASPAGGKSTPGAGLAFALGALGIAALALRRR